VFSISSPLLCHYPSQERITKFPGEEEERKANKIHRNSGGGMRNAWVGLGRRWDIENTDRTLRDV